MIRVATSGIMYNTILYKSVSFVKREHTDTQRQHGYFVNIHLFLKKGNQLMR